MSGIQHVSLRVPAEWDASWFRRFITEALSKADVRNATGSGVTVSSAGNSVATLATDVTTAIMNAAIAAAEAAHEAEANPHPVYPLRTESQSYAYFVS